MLVQLNCFVVLTKSEYFVDSTKKFILIKQKLFDLTKFSWIFNKTVLLVQDKFFSLSEQLIQLCPLGYMDLFKASHSIAEVKQLLARLYLDGGCRLKLKLISIHDEIFLGINEIWLEF